jgi:hypothetical protein
MQLRKGKYVECESSLTPKISVEFLRALVEQGKQAKNQNVAISELWNRLRDDRANGGQRGR